MLLREIKALAGQSVAEPFLKSLFLQLMPSIVRNILAASNGTLDVLATMADRILEASNSQPSYGVAAVSPSPQSEEMNKKFEELCSDLIRCIEQLQRPSRIKVAIPLSFQHSASSIMVTNCKCDRVTSKYCAGTTAHMATMPKTAVSLATSKIKKKE